MDALSETIKGLKINNTGYYESEKNDAKDDYASDPKTVPHTSDGKKRKVTDTSNGNLQQKLLINQTPLIISTMFEPLITDSFATYGGTPHAITKPTTKEVITDAARSSAHILRTPGHVCRTVRDGTIP